MSLPDVTWALGRPTIGGAASLASRLRIYGRDRVPLDGGLVVASNHFSWLDPAVLGAASPRVVYYMAKVEAHRVPGFGAFIRSFGCFPVRRGESDREAVRTMRRIVAEGHALGLFVEGTRQRSGIPGEVQPGAAMVALQEGVPIVPVAIHGTQDWKPGQLQARVDRLGRADDVRRAPEGGPRLQGGLGAAPGGDPPAVRLAGRRPPARPPARRHPPGRTRPWRMNRRGEAVTSAGTVAIVGFPNVGKSTLVNRLTQSRAAVVHETAGVTRDRKELLADWNGVTFRLVDTGGVDEADTGPYGRHIAEQARAAIAEADLVLFVVDARAGITPGDEELAAILRASGTPVIVLANKIDDPRRDLDAVEFHRLGLGDPVPLSALHGHGTGDLLDDVVSRLPGRDEAVVGDEAIRVAILGRPNVGKSSLLNALLGEERVIVSDVPGTTRDTIDTVLQRAETTFLLVDTAGLRRKRRQRQGIEYYSELRALDAAQRADVALVLVDASEGVVEQDLAVADVARKAGCSTLVVLSKWDATTIDLQQTRGMLNRRLRQRPPAVAVSALTGRGLRRLLDHVEALFQKHTARIPTPVLNKALTELKQARPGPAGERGRRLKLLYATQTATRPPRLRIFVNDPRLVTRDYGYWVENELRARFDLQGVPVSIDFQRSE